MLKFYQNAETGEISTEALAGFQELIPNTVDAAREKHVPVISREGQTVTVEVGSTPHPMTEKHYITWILLETNDGIERIELTPDDEPAAQFFASEDSELIAAYAYCNIHGLWMTEA